MRAEHIALQVEDPAATAAWWIEHLDCTMRRDAGGPTGMCFIADESGELLIELYHNPDHPVPDYHNQSPLLFHVAFAVPDMQAAHERLAAAGATEADVARDTPAGDRLWMHRDPWGVPIQLCQRAEALK